MEETWDEAFFWKQLELEHGQINLHIKNILKVQNLCRQSLTNLTRESIGKIAEDMRRMADHYIEAAAEGGDPLLELYGPLYAKQPQKFEFLEGEVLCLLDLAAIIRSRGIKSFLKPRKKQTGSAKTSTSVLVRSVEVDPSGHKLLEKILTYFTSKNISGSFYDNFLEQLQDLTIQVYGNEGDKYRAEVVCPICSSEGKRTKISLAMDRTGSWHIFSFTRHCNAVHLGLSQSSKPKRNSRFDENQVQPAKQRAVCLESEKLDDRSEADKEPEHIAEVPSEQLKARKRVQEGIGPSKRCIGNMGQHVPLTIDVTQEEDLETSVAEKQGFAEHTSDETKGLERELELSLMHNLVQVKREHDCADSEVTVPLMVVMKLAQDGEGSESDDSEDDDPVVKKNLTHLINFDDYEDSE
ncbi:uncharacterized protein LOC135711466 [Ochlerotatus camptorhynchus]|uniref:uncharacterized protein LOC135711466 n=1 Tax=Ochlerotatus camptorhynchus TaxID=644619 RepID=UPI0031DBF2D7